MNDPKVAELLRKRIKYDWVVLLYGLFCVLLLLFTERNFDGFLFFLGCFIYAEIFSIRAYRKLLGVDEAYHLGTKQTLDQDVDVGKIFLCFIMDAFFLTCGTLVFFFMDANKSVVWF
ncbi:MAG: hypothetical protein KBA62_09425 [Polaromonas sp.]|nr:hypothetical protein [Polaromonas sp.]MBP7116511.1 hypothetical protein [Polaromonas sp.]MBP8873992.1 hypothetical protein [Polaromonas sp.]MBP9831373.1 hypothetical protein [Polaromonas sp.]